MADEPKETVLDAINAALGDPKSEAAAADNPPADSEISSDALDDDGAVAEGETPPTEGETTPAEGETPEAKAAREAAETPEQKAEREAAVAEAAKAKPDHMNDPIAPELAKETQTRIRSLIRTAKEAAAAREKVETDFNYLIEGVKATGASPQQYGEILSWVGKINSRDPAQLKEALQLAEDTCERLALMIGVERNVKDPLAGHPDLTQSVQQGQITRDLAVQLARQRDSARFRETMQSGASQQAQQQRLSQQQITQARTDLNSLELELRRTDRRFDEKRAVIVPMLRPLFQQIHPTNWKQAFIDAYKAVRLPAGGGSAATNGGVPANQPLRAKQPAGGGAKAPANMREAIEAGLQRSAGR